MPIRKCHNRRCKNTFSYTRKRGRQRKFCDECISKVRRKAARRNKRYDMPKYLYKLCKLRISRYSKTKYVSEVRREQGRRLAEAAQALLDEHEVRTGNVRHSTGKCRKCAYRLMGERVCPRCGK